jgi:hypothetical protein
MALIRQRTQTQPGIFSNLEIVADGSGEGKRCAIVGEGDGGERKSAPPPTEKTDRPRVRTEIDPEVIARTGEITEMGGRVATVDVDGRNETVSDQLDDENGMGREQGEEDVFTCVEVERVGGGLVDWNARAREGKRRREGWEPEVTF